MNIFNSFAMNSMSKNSLPMMKGSAFSGAPVAPKFKPGNPFAVESVFSKRAYEPHKIRRTDEQAKEKTLWPRDKASYADTHSASLKAAAATMNVPGVYIIYLNGQVMKVGSAEIGVQKRMQQYYGMNPYCGLPQINESNRDRISVRWQDCPVSKCNELESKLARKYGLGPWAKRTPHSTDDTWELLI